MRDVQARRAASFRPVPMLSHAPAASFARLVSTACATGALALLAACAVPAHSAPADAGESGPQPSSFAPAIRRGLAVAVGVYGSGLAFSAAESGSAATRGATARMAEPRPADRVAAGFIVSGSEGLIVTASHGIQGSERIAVRLPDQRIVAATLVGEDEEADIALLRVPVALAEPPPPGRSTALRMGDWVLAVGEPYGLNRSVVAGVVGGKDRHFAEDRELLFIQSDLALNPGNSGGPLLDSTGAVVGMNTRTVVGVYGGSGLSLSIPIEIVMQIVGELRAKGQITRPRLGADFDDVTPFAALAAQRSYASGALVTSVAIDSLAQQLDLRTGDIIVGMNGRPVAHSADLVHLLLGWRTVDGTVIVVMREGQLVQLRWR
jgi:S1-C subfamily serine protease